MLRLYNVRVRLLVRLLVRLRARLRIRLDVRPYGWLRAAWSVIGGDCVQSTASHSHSWHKSWSWFQQHPGPTCLPQLGHSIRRPGRRRHPHLHVHRIGPCWLRACTCVQVREPKRRELLARQQTNRVVGPRVLTCSLCCTLGLEKLASFEPR